MLLHNVLDNSERCVWSFTLRDSPSDLINVTMWGLVNSVKDLYTKFNVGDVGMVDSFRHGLNCIVFQSFLMIEMTLFFSKCIEW